MFTDYSDNLMLTALPAGFVALHNAYPGLIGSNEISGGTPAYARVATSFSAAAGGARTQVGTPSLNVGAGTTVAWVSTWDAGTSGNYLGCSPNGGNPKRYVTNLTANTIISPSHGYALNQQIVFYGKGSVPGGTTAGVIVYVIAPTTDTFQVSATSGGAAIALTSNASANTFVSAISSVSYGSQSTHSLPTGSQTLNG